MEGTIMVVNLCPSSNIGKASCSVHSRGSEGQLFYKTENQAIVRLEHSFTAICPENGEIQYMTIIPDKNVGHNVKDEGKDRRGCMGKDTSLPGGYSVNELRSRNNGQPSSFTGHKSLLPNHGNASLRTEVYNNKEKVRFTYPAARKEALSDHDGIRRGVEIDSISKSRKRKSVEESDSEDEKKPRKNKQWSRANMLKAIAAVQNGMRIRRAAKQFAVPRTTLKYKLDSQIYSREPESMELSKNLNEKVETKATEHYKDSKRSKQEAQTLQETQEILKSNEIEGQKNTDTRECLNISKKPSTISSNNNDKSARSDLHVPLQHSRNLRSNSRILENKVVQLNELSDSKKPVNLQVNKSKTEVESLDSYQKSKRTNDSMFDKELRNKNEKKLHTNEEMKFVERKCFKLWSEEAMKKAISAVEQGCKIREAATVFGVPRSTLGRKISLAFKPQSLAVNQQSKPQTNDSAEVQFVGIRQSPRRQKPMPVPVSSGVKSLPNEPCVIPTSETKGGEKSKDVNAPEHKKEDTTTDKGRQRAKNWSEESMGKALEAVDQGMSLRSAAMKFNLPTASLKTRKYKRDGMNNRFEGPEPHISTEDEDVIVNYVNDCATFGIINVKEVALLLAAEAAERELIWDIKKQGLPSDEWWGSFCTRRGSHIKNVDVLQANNKTKVTEGRIGLFYDKLSAVKNSSQYHETPLANCSDCRTFTVQEFKYDLNAVTEWVSEGVDTETSTKMLPETDPSNKLVSAICCASAAGNSIPPMFVYHTENNYKIPSTGLVGPFGAVHFVHNVHDMTRKSDFYFKWFSDVFLKYAPQSRPLILIFDPNTAFITPEFIQLAHKNEIILLGLPPFCAHIIQPLNRKVFPALKKGFSFTSSLFKRIFVKGVNFNNFARCFKVAWNSSVDAAIIKAGFSEAGIHPINRKVILKLNNYYSKYY